MIKKIICLLFLIIPLYVVAQQYPQEIMPGTSKTITATTDTLWILKNSQLKNAIIKAKELEIANQQIEELKKIIGKTDTKDTEKDSLIVDLKKDRDYYKDIWQKTDNNLNKVAKEYKCQKLYTKIAIGCGIVATTLAIIFL